MKKNSNVETNNAMVVENKCALMPKKPEDFSNSLREKYDLIKGLENDTKKNCYKIAFILDSVSDEELTENGFATTAEFAKATFGYDKGTTSKMISAVKMFCTDDSGNYNVPTDKFGNIIPMSNLYETLRLGKEKVNELIDKCKITATTSQKEIRKTVSEICPAKPKAKNTKSNDVKAPTVENDEKTENFGTIAKEMADIEIIAAMVEMCKNIKSDIVRTNVIMSLTTATEILKEENSAE